MNAISASPEGDDASGANEQPSEALPVQDGRFKPGRSGNPKGRPRRRALPNNALDQALGDEVIITDGRGKRKVQSQVVIAKRMVQLAMAGNMAAVKTIEAARPGFLLRALEVECSKDLGAEMIRHLADEMGTEAFLKYGYAMKSWLQKRQELGLDDPGATGGRRRRRR